MLLKKFNDSAEENGFSRPSNCLCQKTFTAKNVSLTAAFVALIATEKKKLGNNRTSINQSQIGTNRKSFEFQKTINFNFGPSIEPRHLGRKEFIC